MQSVFKRVTIGTLHSISHRKIASCRCIRREKKLCILIVLQTQLLVLEADHGGIQYVIYRSFSLNIKFSFTFLFAIYRNILISVATFISTFSVTAISPSTNYVTDRM